MTAANYKRSVMMSGAKLSARLPKARRGAWIALP